VADIDGTNLSNIRPLSKASSSRTEDLFDLEISADGSKIVFEAFFNSAWDRLFR
jgi:hypothetical protein